MIRRISAILCFLFALATAQVPIAKFYFEDAAEKAGLTGKNVLGGLDRKDYVLETTGNGVAIFDYDGDGQHGDGGGRHRNPPGWYHLAEVREHGPVEKSSPVGSEKEGTRLGTSMGGVATLLDSVRKKCSRQPGVSPLFFSSSWVGWRQAATMRQFTPTADQTLKIGEP